MRDKELFKKVLVCFSGLNAQKLASFKLFPPPMLASVVNNSFKSEEFNDLAPARLTLALTEVLSYLLQHLKFFGSGSTGICFPLLRYCLSSSDLPPVDKLKLRFKMIISLESIEVQQDYFKSIRDQCLLTSDESMGDYCFASSFVKVFKDIKTTDIDSLAGPAQQRCLKYIESYVFNVIGKQCFGPVTTRTATYDDMCVLLESVNNYPTITELNENTYPFLFVVLFLIKHVLNYFKKPQGVQFTQKYSFGDLFSTCSKIISQFWFHVITHAKPEVITRLLLIFPRVVSSVINLLIGLCSKFIKRLMQGHLFEITPCFAPDIRAKNIESLSSSSLVRVFFNTLLHRNCNNKTINIQDIFDTVVALFSLDTVNTLIPLASLSAPALTFISCLGSQADFVYEYNSKWVNYLLISEPALIKKLLLIDSSFFVRFTARDSFSSRKNLVLKLIGQFKNITSCDLLREQANLLAIITGSIKYTCPTSLSSSEDSISTKIVPRMHYKQALNELVFRMQVTSLLTHVVNALLSCKRSSSPRLPQTGSAATVGLKTLLTEVEALALHNYNSMRRLIRSPVERNLMYLFSCAQSQVLTRNFINDDFSSLVSVIYDPSESSYNNERNGSSSKKRKLSQVHPALARHQLFQTNNVNKNSIGSSVVTSGASSVSTVSPPVEETITEVYQDELITAVFHGPSQ
jgi:hypothetical protein